jgi:hypothetical protein
MSYNRYQRRHRAFANPDIDPTTTYAGEAADFYVAPAIHGADTVANNWVTQLDGIQNKAVISGASVAGDVIQSATCDFSDGDSVIVDERVLTLTDLKVNESLCRGTILPTWQGMTGARQSMDWSNDSFRNFVFATIAAKTAESVENNIWVGGKIKGLLSNDGTFDSAGWAASTLQGASEQAISAITNANAIAQFNLVYTKMATTTPAVLTKPDAAFYVNPKTYALYCQQLAGLGSAVSGTTGQGINNQATAQAFNNVSFMGIPVHVSGGMPDSCIVMAQESNLYVGSNLRTDYTQAAVIPVYQYDGSDNIRVTMQFGLGVQAGRLTEIVVGALSTIL